MNIVKIGSQERSLNDAGPHWIEQRINGLRRDGEAVTVVVRIQVGDGDLCFVAPPSGGGAPRQYSTAQRAIIALWSKCGMNTVRFSPGDLISFLKQLPHYLP
ncbi:MAG TPA: hypothetical protein VJL61_05195 [Rhodanobacteraceae bacterium]|nr:hypothetical protein [Rhodanobacteraceae bacterium]